ncbi:MAG: MBL fold metallo-hydrolase [Candidatus Saccharibacteria bacterium]|nr:MBL fold metallo-hydrolase [Candidatus Saccharibacteria bacterium]
MFDVEYKGANAVVFTTKNTRVVFDPALSLVGLKDVTGAQDVQVVTEERFAVKNTTNLTFDGPGEYEVGDISLKGLPAQRHIDADNDVKNATIYRLAIGDVRCAVLGNIAPKLSDEQLEGLGVVDIVVVPVGGHGYTLDATAAATVVRQLEPKVVIPVHYADVALQYEVPQDELSVFVSEMGAAEIEAGHKWKVKNAASLPEQLSIVKITRS